MVIVNVVFFALFFLFAYFIVCCFFYCYCCYFVITNVSVTFLNISSTYIDTWYRLIGILGRGGWVWGFSPPKILGWEKFGKVKGRKERKGGKGKREENSETKKAKGEIIRSKGRTERKKEEKLGQRIFSFRTRWLSLLLPPPSPALDRSGALICRLWISSIINNMRGTISNICAICLLLRSIYFLNISIFPIDC